MLRERYVKSFYLIVPRKITGLFLSRAQRPRLWNHAVVIAQKLGRRVSCSTASGFSAEDTARNWLQRYSGKQVLPGENRPPVADL
jgi:hypothetical protein